MKTHRLAISCAFCLMILLIPLSVVNCQNYVKYSIQLNADGSALWKIIHFSETNASVDTWAGFQNKALDLVNSASNITHRSMSIDENSMQINTTVSSESKTTEYTFLWQNFSIIQGNQIIFGDVFQVNSFFSQLYGDAAVEVCYPTTFEVKSVNPPPYQQDNPAKTLEWARTQDLLSSKTNIILTNTAVNENSSQNNWQQYIIAGSIVLVGATVFFAGFFMFKRRKNTVETAIFTVTSVETEEEKILKLLKSSGGSLRQSVIVEQCRFSKAKTSQLLAILERKGNITRLKKGRDKIVTLKETAKR